MPDFETCKKTLLHYLKARIPFVGIKSEERKRATSLFREVAKEINAPIFVHTLSEGTRDLKTDKIAHDDKTVAGVLDFASGQIKQRQNLTFVLTEVQDLDGDNATTRQMLDLATFAESQGGVLAIITTSDIFPRLQRAGMVLTLDPPNEFEMQEIIQEILESYKGAITIEWGPEEIKQVGIIMAGFLRSQVENQIMLLVAKGSVLKTDVAELSTMKDRMFANISGLERVKVSAKALSVGGLAGLNAWLDMQRPLLSMDLREKGLRPPRGMLLVGVPGCGKSLSAKAVAAHWNLALYRLDLANIHGQYLGQSEQRLKEALATADRLAPCVLWIDEIEKGLAGGGDGGTSTRLVGHFLYWLQEGTARVFVVSTANDISKLPAELFRRGRFDELFFVDLPNESERRDIISLYASKYLRQTLDDGLLNELVKLSEGFAGSDLEAATSEMAKTAIIKGAESINSDSWQRVFANVVPLSRTNPEQIEAIRAWGRERAVPASGKPIGGADPTRQKPGRQVLS